MDVRRIEGVKYNIERLTNQELENMREHLNQTIIRLMGEMAIVDNELFARHHEELPYDEL